MSIYFNINLSNAAYRAYIGFTTVIIPLELLCETMCKETLSSDVHLIKDIKPILIAQHLI